MKRRNLPHPFNYLGLVAFWATGFFSFSSAFAQFPQARLDWIFPTGLQSGSSSDVQLSGADLENLTALKFSHPGLSAKPGKDGKWSISAAKEVPTGVYELRSIGAWGISSPLPLAVGPLAEIREVEPNEIAPQSVALPVTINGQIQAATDVDNYTLKGKKGQRLALQVVADAIDSPLDATLRVIGPTGSQIAESQDRFGYDPALELILPADGDYKIQIFDAVYGGSPAYTYRLSIHGGPVLDSVVPAAAVGSTSLKLLGRGFDARPDAAFPKIMGQPEESVAAQIQANAIAPIAFGNYSNADQAGRVPFSQASSLKFITSWPLARATEPVQVEIESNDTAKQAQPLQPPFDLTGLFQRPGDVDYYQFSAKKDEIWVIETIAQRQNSQALPEIVVEQLQPDGSVKTITEIPEVNGNAFGPAFETDCDDRKTTWKAPADGNYLLHVNHANKQEGDARFYYRVVLRRPRPDFQLIAMPNGATGPTGVTLLKGGRAVISALINKVDGFDQPVLVSATNLPAGVKCYPAIIPAGQNRTNLILEAASNATPVEFPVVLEAKTRWSDSKDLVDWNPGQPPEVEFKNTIASIGGGVVRAFSGPNNQQRGLSRYTEHLWVALRDSSSPFQLEPEPLRLFAKRGTTVDLPVNATRTAGFDAPIALKLENLPPSMEAVAVNMEKAKNSAVLKCKIGANVPLGRHTVYISGTAPAPFAKDAAAKQKPNINWTIPSRPVTLIVTP